MPKPRITKPAALLLLLSPALAAGADIPGRLFFSATQRASLDAARSANLQAAKRAAESRPSDSETLLPGPELSLNGIIKSEGRTQLLINNQVRDAKPGEIVFGSSARVANQRGGAVDIKVGQRLNPYTGKVENDSKKAPAAENAENRETTQP